MNNRTIQTSRAYCLLRQHKQRDRYDYKRMNCAGYYKVEHNGDAFLNVMSNVDEHLQSIIGALARISDCAKRLGVICRREADL